MHHMATAWWKDKRQMEKQKQLTWGVIIILSSHLWRAKGLISILKLSAAVLDSLFVLHKVARESRCPVSCGVRPQTHHQTLPFQWWMTQERRSGFIFKKKKPICIHMLMFSLSFYLPLLLYYEPCSVSRVLSAYACSSVPAPGSALTSVAVFAAITRGSFHTALGLQRDIGAQRD